MAATTASSSSTSPVFPRSSSPTKGALSSNASNPHPYAIKTTSTGVLTRSNSSHSTSSASHRFVPSSPTKPKSSATSQSRQGSGGGNGSSHRYSRSLNTDLLPRPLPVPPNFPSPSPTKSEFDPVVEVQQHRRERRADTLPGSSEPPQLGVVGATADEQQQPPLPDDPRTWTPSQLSTYLASSLRVTSGDLPPLVAKDMAAFVRTQKITGRRFLRLNEGDLDKYGLNQRWQVALLNASRALRQDSLRGRIWNPNALPDDERHSPNSSSSSSGSANDSPLETGNGRVRGMVATLERERSYSVDDATRGPTRSASPGKKRSLSPVKRTLENPDDETEDATPYRRSRPRPQSAIFPSHSSYTMEPSSMGSVSVSAAGQEQQQQQQQQKQQAKEPRLLPLPPSSPSQVLPDFVGAFGATTSPLQQFHSGMPPQLIYGPPPQPTFSPPLMMMDSSAAFPSGVLPFSPEPTGGGAGGVPPPINPALYVNAVVVGDNGTGNSVRPLPLPPHPGQIYQTSMQGYGGVVMTHTGASDSLNYSGVGEDDDSALHRENEGIHVQVEHVSPLLSHGRGLVSLDPQPPPYAPHQPMVLPGPHYQPGEQQQQPGQEQMAMPIPIPIHAPQPRDGRAEQKSPTKVLEEKLEELLEPRLRYTGIAPTTAGQHSRTPSRPRSRVTSLAVEDQQHHVPVPGTGAGSGAAESPVPSQLQAQSQHLGVNGNSNPRKRVISLSRAHTHRLSGVEAWGESHRHIVVPPDEDAHMHGHAGVEGGAEGGDGMVKEMEAEEEMGIEAVLEKEVPVGLGLPLSFSAAEESGSQQQHSREGSGSGGSAGHSRAGSLREPKSAVITVVERKPSSSRRLKKGEERLDGKGKKRVVSGAEAWEMVNVDTVKHLEDSGFLLSSSVTSSNSRRSIEDIFSPHTQPRPRPKHAEDGEREEALKKRESEVERRERDVTQRARKVEELEGRERELETSVGETRKAVEVLRERLEGVERWMEEREREEVVERKAAAGWTLGLMRRVLGAGRLPGMLGLSAWLGSRPVSKSAPSTTSATAAPPQEEKNSKKARMTLICRFAKIGVNFSTYAVLLGIGVCVLMLKALGKRPVVKVGGTGVGVRLGVDVVGKGFRR